MTEKIREDVEHAKSLLAGLQRHWDGRECILELKEADYNWRQMEWIGWYFEWKCQHLLKSAFDVPGDSIGRVQFDSKRTINWDFKSHAIKSHTHKAILNDCDATEAAIKNDGAYGIVIALLNVDYNDDDRTFQKWHTDLKGGLSDYEVERRKRTSVSRFRKTRAELEEILFVVFENTESDSLGIHRQGRNSDGSPRKPKFIIDIEEIGDELIAKI